MHATTATSTKTLLIGNLPDGAPSAAIVDWFSRIGKVVEVALLPYGFAFVEMTAPDADRALVQLNGSRFNGQVLMVDEAHPRRGSKY